ncbi:MAG: hypothetical protein NVSMB44_24600 [Ktedonobacteraceae bacterium]
MTLLRVNLFLKLQPDQGNDSAKNERGDHVPNGSQEGHTDNTRNAPALCARDNSQRKPVVGEHGMQNGHSSGSP